MATGPKVTRKDLKEDKVYVTLAEVADAVVRYRLPIALAVLVAVAVFAMGYHLRARSGRMATEASWALYQANFMEASPERTAALEKVVADYGGTQAARFASFGLANALYDEGKYDEALESFRKFLKENSNHLLAPSAAEAVGYCQESLGQWKEAIQTYDDLMRRRPDSSIAARASYRAGHCHEKLNENEKAIEAYEKVLALAPESLWADYSNQRLASLSPETHSPVETEPLMPPGFASPFTRVPPPPPGSMPPPAE